MVISKKHKYIFIAVPKTGTTSIEKLLMENDSSAEQWGTVLEDQYYKIPGHATALQVRNILGDYYNDYRTFGFIRNPYSRIVSGYHFFKNDNHIKRGGTLTVKKILKSISVKIMSLKMYASIYPYRSNREFLVDEKGDLMVDYVGTFENLKQDLSAILGTLKLSVPVSKLKHLNKSPHSDYTEYFGETTPWIIKRKIKDDLEFYNQYKFNLVPN